MPRMIPDTIHMLPCRRAALALHKAPRRRAALAGLSLLALAACQQTAGGGMGGGFDMDLRSLGDGFSTTEAAQRATAQRPQPDGRGVISYPNYQVAVAGRGDTVRTVAARVGVGADELARYNAVSADAPLNPGEVLALPGRVAAAPVTGGSIAGGPIDITTIASGAIDRAQVPGGTVAAAPAPVGAEPVRHRVVRGETAYTVARAYGVSVRSLADWNGLTGEMTVREGQYLLIPVVVAGVTQPANATSAPGQGTATPTPPSASQPLPEERTVTANTPVATPPAPDLGGQTAASASAKFVMPVQGSIIRGYAPKKNDGIDIAASAGATVKAADAGTVAAITKDTDQVPILVIRHPNNLLTVYANIDGITVAKGATVARGQAIAKVRAGSPAFMHFEVRDGYDSVDPMKYLQ